MAAIRLGLDAKLYRNTAAYAAPAWNEIKNVKDVTLNLEATEADVTTRGNNGWKATVATLKDGSIEFELVWDPTDAHFTAFLNAFLQRGSVELAVMDGVIADAGSQGLRATCAITKFTRTEPLEEAVKASVTAKPTFSDHAPEWLVVA